MTAPLPRLSPDTLPRLGSLCRTPAYDRDAARIGVVHFGPGAFHRAHQAVYFDDLLAEDPRWGVCEVALRTPGVQQALSPQDGLYVIAALGETVEHRVIGAIKALLTASETPEAVLARLRDPEVKVYSSTVTEKGYCLASDGQLDFAHPDILGDLRQSGPPSSLIGWLVAGLKARRDDGAGGVTVLCCDNLSDNGHKLRAAVLAFAQRLGDGDLADWIDAECRFPCTMVDSITPATDDALRERIETALGVHDAWPIQRESFRQWVIEANLRPDAPDLARAGAILTDNVRGFEQAKLRLLNGAHSALAYCGLMQGYDSVAAAMADPELKAFIASLMREEILPSLPPLSGFDLDAYIDAILARFENPNIRHLLSQIAWDGSQKLPIRWLATVADNLEAGRPITRFGRAIGAWIAFIIRQTETEQTLVDPLAETLQAFARTATGDAAADVAGALRQIPIFPSALAGNPDFVAAVEQGYQRFAWLYV